MSTVPTMSTFSGFTFERRCKQKWMARSTLKILSIVGIISLTDLGANGFVLNRSRGAFPDVSGDVRRRVRPIPFATTTNQEESSLSSADTELPVWVNSVQQGISRRKDAKYIRILPRSVRGSRQCFDLQTAVTRFERILQDGSVQTVELHSQLHFGTQDYFDYYNTKEFQAKHSRVLYELLIDDALMETSSHGLRSLRPSPDGGPVLMASQADANTASQYGLNCQVDLMDYSNPNWIHADLTRQELIEETARVKGTPNVVDNGDKPLWALASTANTFPGAEAVSALFRPSTPSTSLSTPVARRLFSNLFLPGNALAGLLRSLFWLTLPSPELSVLVLDWSSILPRPTGSISQVALPVLECLFTGNIQEARKLVFGQMLAAGQSSSGDETLLVKKRNDHALEVLQKCMDSDSKISSGRSSNKNYALLYGAMHCGDLQQKLSRMGFVPRTTQWRTAWSVNVPNFGTSTGQNGLLESFASSSSPSAIAVGLVVLPLYFLVGGLDWIATIEEFGISLNDGNLLDAGLGVTLYLMRHVLLYLGLAKFVVEWDGGTNLFSNDNR